ncbi:YlmH family RNA-binding protein [Oceanobacillus manasiensis]|uniref:YlmH family RNA-binding protein n=1 Tax=Oceanobacillus manasiensis TaxID=586413 RepID=UPI0005A9A666|nr:RNA-binding protein [Oceanobacillus manasiensis]
MDIYQHFRKDEQPFIDKVLTWKEQVERNFQPKLTDFLDPREQQIVQMLVGGDASDLKLSLDGGTDHAERRRAIIAPYYEEISREDFQLTLCQATYQSKFVTVEHRDVMGAFLSLGIKRQKLGDIAVENGILQFVLADEITPFVTTNLNSIKKAKISLEKKSLSEGLKTTQQWDFFDKTVSSLRLDTVLKEIYHLSRKDASAYIAKQQVKVNYKIVEDGKYGLQAGDLLSLRGKGRSKLTAINGTTKKDKLKITIAVLK